MKIISTLFLLLFVLISGAQNRDKAFTINKNLGRGINYGNMFEAPSERAWGTGWKPDYARKIAELGFNHIRIPVRWETDARSQSSPPYTISETFLNRIKQVVDSALNNGLYAIINMHHHDSLYNNPASEKARFLSQWNQIATFFKDYPDSLLFEVLNEPHGNLTPEDWNVFFADALQQIRTTNPTRVVLMGSGEYGGLGGLSKLQIPDDDNLILTIHYYNPFQFTHQGASWVGSQSNEWLGTKWRDTEDERQIVKNDFAPLKAFEKTNNIPVHIGEFGSYYKADMDSRVRWTTFIARYIESLNWSWAYWEFNAGFGIYDPDKNIYRQPLVDALLRNQLPEPWRYVGTTIYKSDFSKNSTGWNLIKHQGSASLKRINNSLDVDIASGGTKSWHIQLMKSNIRLEAGKKYRFSFRAKSSANRTAATYIGMNKDPWSAYSGFNNFSLTDTFATYTFIFDMSTTDYNTRLVFDIGNSSEDFELKDVLIEEIVLSPPTESTKIKTRDLQVYPNPVTDVLTVNCPEYEGIIKIFNLAGQVVLQQKLNSGLNRIPSKRLSKGTYLATIKTQNQYQSVKIIKQ